MIMHPDFLSFSPNFERHIHNLRSEIMYHFSTTRSGFLISHGVKAARLKLTDNKASQFDIHQQHFQLLHRELGVSPGEATLLGLFSTIKLKNLYLAHIRNLFGKSPSLKQPSFETVVAFVQNGISTYYQAEIPGPILTELRTWLFVLKNFGDSYTRTITLPDSEFTVNKLLAAARNSSQQLDKARLPVFDILYEPMCQPIKIQFAED